MKKILILFSVIILLNYLVLYTNTNSLSVDFHNVVKNNRMDNIIYGELERYAIPDFIHYNNIDVNLQRLFVIHNFRKGTMWVKYSYIAYDDNNNAIAGSTNVISKWNIKKTNGRWEVIKITEKP